MSQFVEVKTAELVGPALNWSVAKALGWVIVSVPNDIDGKHGGEVLAPPTVSDGYKFPPRGQIGPGYFLLGWSRDWAFGGPLISSHCEAVRKLFGEWHATSTYGPSGYSVTQVGPTPLIAACRAIVAVAMGKEVQVPVELMGVSA